jgi:hypothetical protein
MAVVVWQKRPMVICMRRRMGMFIKTQVEAGINMTVTAHGLRHPSLRVKWLPLPHDLAVRPLLQKCRMLHRTGRGVIPAQAAGAVVVLEEVVGLVVVVTLAAVAVVGEAEADGEAVAVLAVEVAAVSAEVVLAAEDELFTLCSISRQTLSDHRYLTPVIGLMFANMKPHAEIICWQDEQD